MTHPQPDTLSEIVFEIWGSAIRSADLKELSASIRNSLRRIIDVDNFYICLYNHEKDSLTLLYRIDQTELVKKYEHYYVEHVKESSGLTAEVIKRGQSLLVHKEDDWQKSRSAGQKIVGTAAEVWLGVPLKIKDKVQGVLVVQSYNNPEQYDHAQKELLEALADPIAAALEYKKMEEARFRDETIKQALFNIASAVKQTSDLNELYRSIHQSLKQVIDLPNFFICFYDKQKDAIDYPYIVDEQYSTQSEPTTARVDLKNKFSLSQQVFEHGQPLRFNKEKILKGIRETGKDLIGTIPEIWLGFPLKNRNEVVGIMATQSYSDPFHFSEKDIEVLTAVSDQIGLAIDRKRADDEARKRAERLAVINRIGRLSATVDTLDQLLQAIYEEINVVFKPDAFFISFLDQKTNELEFRFLIEDNKKQPIVRFPLREGFSSKVILDRKPLVIRDYEREKENLPPGLLFGNQKRALSWIGIPLKYRDQVIGLVNIQSFQPCAWNDEDIQLFFTIADQLAGMLEKARLFEEARKRAERLTVINQIGKVAATATNLEMLMSDIYAEINAIFKPDGFYIAFYDRADNALEFRFLVEEDEKLSSGKFPLGNGLSAKVIMENKPLIIQHYNLEKNNLPPQLKLNKIHIAQSWVGVPLSFEGQVIGLVNIQSYRANAWDEMDIQLFFTITDQIAGTFAKARLFEDARARAEHLAVINRIGNAAGTANNLDTLMEAVYVEINLIFKPDVFFIAFYDKQSDELEFRFHINTTDGKQPVAKRPLGAGFSSKVINKKKALVVRNFEQEKDLLPHPITIGNRKTPLSWVGVPLLFEKQVIGIVSIQAYKPYAWNDEDIQLFFTITDQIAGSIEKARLFEESRKRLERLAVLNRIGMLAASAQNIDQMLNNIYEEIDAIFKPDSFFLAFYDATADELEFKILMDEGQKSENQRVPIGNGLSSKVIAEKRPLVINHYEKEKSNLPKQMTGGKRSHGSTQSWIGVPLMFEGELIGIVNIQSYMPNAWNHEDQQLFFTIADQIGAIIQKTRLYESVQLELNERKKAEEEARRRAERLTVLNRIGNLAASATNLDQLLSSIYEEINHIYKPDSCFIAFYNEKTNELEFKVLLDEGEKSAEKRLPIGNGLSAKVITEKKALVIHHYDQERGDLPAQISAGKSMGQPSQSWIGVPLMFGGELTGMVNIQSFTPNAWNREDEQLFFTIADQIGAVIQKARLYEAVQLELNERKKAEEEARRRAERLTVINRIGNLPATATNLDRLLADIYKEINAVFKPMIFFIAFYYIETEEIEFRFLIRKGEKRESLRLPLGHGLSAKVIREKRALIINDYEKEKEHLPRQMALPNGEMARSWIGVPLIFEGRVIGIVSMQAFEPDVWNKEDQQFFFTITDQIAGSIAKARLYEALEQELNERKKAEEENKKLESQLRQAQKMEAIGTLAGGIAHDFNNVLYPIIGFTEMTQDLVPEESLAKKNLDEILIASERARSLVQQILTFSRQQEYNPQPLRVQPILKEALKLMRSSMPTTISLIQKIEETCGPVLSDPSQIHQIVMNLCTNAYHAMKTQGGILEVQLSEIDIAPGQTEKRGSLYPGLYLSLTVRDTGHGIDPLIMERIFDPYFTTKPPGEGTGMGLALVHGIVKSFGGEIRVTSQPSQGTLFQILLPRVMEKEQESVLTLPKCIPGKGERILVIDDEEQILDMIELMLQSLNYKVMAKMESIAALEAFRQNPDNFDLVITDQTMPGLTGFELSKRMLAIRPGIPIILCTGFSELVNEELVKAAGISKFILKPILKSQLSTVIREVLGEEISMDA